MTSTVRDLLDEISKQIEHIRKLPGLHKVSRNGQLEASEDTLFSKEQCEFLQAYMKGDILLLLHFKYFNIFIFIICRWDEDLD
jgi:hypothetical protein